MTDTPQRTWTSALDPWGGAPIIHDGTGVNEDVTTAARMFHMEADHHDINAALSYLNALEREVETLREERDAYKLRYNSYYELEATVTTLRAQLETALGALRECALDEPFSDSPASAALRALGAP